nr:unnamed protein product [Digitaria exilis]
MAAVPAGEERSTERRPARLRVKRVSESTRAFGLGPHFTSRRAALPPRGPCAPPTTALLLLVEVARFSAARRRIQRRRRRAPASPRPSAPARYPSECSAGSGTEESRPNLPMSRRAGGTQLRPLSSHPARGASARA